MWFSNDTYVLELDPERTYQIQEQEREEEESNKLEQQLFNKFDSKILL